MATKEVVSMPNIPATESKTSTFSPTLINDSRKGRIVSSNPRFSIVFPTALVILPMIQKPMISVKIAPATLGA